MKLFSGGASVVAFLVLMLAAVQCRAAADGGGLSLGENVRVGGEAGAGFFDTGYDGVFPNNEFRIDEAKLFLDAKITDEVFFFTELNLTLRETPDDSVLVGEIYIEAEGLEKLWGGGPTLTLRAGRLDIPFGEEYLTRDAADDAFINHTLADVWGVDEGVELFGKAGAVDYTLAVQNGSYLRTRDGDPDKSVTARVAVEPGKGLRFSASAMRTGDLDPNTDMLSEVWFGNGYIGPMGGTNVTKFHVNLAQLDARYRWEGGHAAISAGGIEYDDNDSAADHATDAKFWSAEVVQDVFSKAYVGARYSRVSSSDGFPVPGNADQTDYAVDHRVDSIWRGSLVVGYRFGDHVIWKAEYTAERGEKTSGEKVDGVDMVATEIAVGF